MSTHKLKIIQKDINATEIYLDDFQLENVISYALASDPSATTIKIELRVSGVEVTEDSSEPADCSELLCYAETGKPINANLKQV